MYKIIKFSTEGGSGGGIGFIKPEYIHELNAVLDIGIRYAKCINMCKAEGDSDSYPCEIHDGAYGWCVPCCFYHSIVSWEEIGEVKDIKKESLANYKDMFWWHGGDCC